LMLWSMGEITGFVYVTMLGEYPLMFNYITNIVMLAVLWHFRRDPCFHEESNV